jgi:hypothetical protein
VVIIVTVKGKFAREGEWGQCCTNLGLLQLAPLLPRCQGLT